MRDTPFMVRETPLFLHEPPFSVRKPPFRPHKTPFILPKTPFLTRVPIIRAQTSVFQVRKQSQPAKIFNKLNENPVLAKIVATSAPSC